MFKSHATFIFPNLVFLKDVSFKSWSEQGRTTKLYKLGWDAFDGAILKRHIDWNAKCWPSTNLPFIQRFDEYYENFLHSLRFVIPANYLTEIRRCTQQALIEWNIQRSFDTSIREMCLGPAIKYIQTAFKLIADCAYDEKTNYFLRLDNKYLLGPLMMFRFWQHQTGAGVIAEHSDFNKLEIILSMLKTSTTYSEGNNKQLEIESLERFLEHFNKQAINIQKAFSDNVKLELGGSTSGPSKKPSSEISKNHKVYLV